MYRKKIEFYIKSTLIGIAIERSSPRAPSAAVL